MSDVAAFYNTIAGEYDGYYAQPVDKAEDRLTSTILHRHILPGMKVLDVGCGTGHTAVMELVQSYRYTGVDISPGMVSQAKVRWPCRMFHVGDMEDLAGFAECDVITCLNGAGLYAKDYPQFVKGMWVKARKAVILSVPLPAHRARHTLTEGSPGKRYMSYREIIEPFERMFSHVEATTYSSGFIDRMNQAWLDEVGVRWPRWLRPYFVIVEATV